MFHLQKRLCIAALLALTALILVACGDSTPTASPATSSGLSGAVSSNRFEIFSWWTNGGEADGKNALLSIYKKQYPGINVIDATVAGGAGTNAKTVLVTRMQGGQPPDTFQVHAGQELIGTWVTSGKMEPITQLFKDQGWDKVMPKLLLDQITYKGDIYSVPVNIHRSNVLWYNKKIFDANGLTAPTTWDDFFKTADILKSKNITPLAVGGKDGFETPHLFESILLATYGPDDYPKLFNGGLDMTKDPRTPAAVATLTRALSYANPDRASLGWADAAQTVLDGKAAMTIMGDWADGYFVSKGAKGNVDFSWAASPGTDGTFIWLSDSFGLPKGAPERDATVAWLTLVGSKQGQDAFNPKKGSIPARTDADRSLYDTYLNFSIDQFKSDKLVPSIVHGAAAPEAFVTAYDNALNVFSADLNAKTLTQALVDAADNLNK